MIVDSHQHYWRIDRGDYDWMSPELDTLCRDYLPEHLEPLLQQCGVTGTIIVQAAETESETRFLLELAKSNASVLGVVGWADMAAPDFSERLNRLIESGSGFLKGLRPMVQDIPDPNWILSSSLDAAFEELADRDLVFDALVYPIHLPQLEKRLRQHSGLKCVIDHGGKPDIAHHLRSAWSAAMGSLATNTNAMCKLSGLVTEAGAEWTACDIRPYVGDLIHHFGADRLIWGSDWPVLSTTSDYADWLDLARRLCGRLDERDLEKIFHENAITTYELEVASCV